MVAPIFAVLVSVMASGTSARAAGQTITVWWTQGYFSAEDQAIREMVAAWEKETGNRVNLSFYPQADLVTKIVAAMTAGEVPDLCYSVPASLQFAPQSAWNDRLTDVSDVIETQEAHYARAVLAAARLYDNVTHTRRYFSVPLAQYVLHYFAWRPMIEAAGYTAADIPNSWEAFFDFFQEVQTRLHAKGQRVYGLGYSVATKDTDSTILFNQFLVAYGGSGIVTPDGRLHIDDPKVRTAAVKALTQLTTPYKQGFVPPGAINWGDPDNNSAFFARQIVMTPNASLSIPMAQTEKTEQYAHEILTLPQPTGPDGTPVTSLVSATLAFVPKGSHNPDGAKAFLKFLIQPEHLDRYLTATRGRFQPPMATLVKDDPYWTDPGDPHRPVVVRQEFERPTMPFFQVFNPAYAEVNTAQIWGKAEANVMIGGMAPEQAVDQAFQQIRAIFAKYPVPAE